MDAVNKGFMDSKGELFIAVGLNYYRPDTGWAPQLWKQMDVGTTRLDFQKMKDLGINVARVFVTYGSFYTEMGKLDAEGLAKFDLLLDIADEFGIYIHPTDLEGWDGMPEWTNPLGKVHAHHGDEAGLKSLEDYWTIFPGRYRGRSTIWACDLKNEPWIIGDSSDFRKKWDEWRTACGQPFVSQQTQARFG